MSKRRPQFRYASAAAVVLFASLAVGSCSSSDDAPTAPAVTTGSVAVAVTTSGAGAPDDYTVALDDGTARTVVANGSTTFASVGGGDHTVTLGSIPENCTVGGANPRSVSVAAGQATNVAFSVTCISLAGSLEVTTATSGADTDPDGYEVEIDGEAGIAIGGDETLAPQALSVGDHEVELTGIADNCMVSGANPRTVTIEFDETTATTFEVTCDATTGAIEVTTTTTGDDIDPDGYTVDLDGEDSESIDANGTTTFTGVSEGAHSLTLEDVADNCTVATDNPADATVEIDETDEVAFEVTCVEFNAAPSATIAAPDPNPTIAPLSAAPGDPVTFTGSATDPEDGPLTGASLVWTSNVDGQIGTGETFQTSSLSEGQHAVTLTATDSEGETDAPQTLVIVVPPTQAGYQIHLRLSPETSLTPGQRTAIEDAITKLESVVVGDLPDEPISLGAGACGPDSPVIDEIVDDHVIYLSVVEIDGPGGVLGSAGPCWVRNGSTLPAIGVMRFDEDDVAEMEANGTVDEVLLHEAMHTMGFASGIWSLIGGLFHDPTDPDDEPPFPDTYFGGANAVDAFDDLETMTGTTYTGGNVVPLENDAENWGPGSLNSHWREGVFGVELMTPGLNSGAPANPLSILTIGLFEDLGYTVDYGAAEPYSPVFSLHGLHGADAGPTIDLSNDVWQGPLWVGNGDGTARRIR